MPEQGRLGRRPRLHLRGEPPLPAKRRREVHHRGKLRSGSAAAHALSRQGRYKDAGQNLKVKEVRIADDERFVICFNPEAAERAAAVRAKMIARLEDVIKDSDQLSRHKRAELRGVISTTGHRIRTTHCRGRRPEVPWSRAAAAKNVNRVWPDRAAA